VKKTLALSKQHLVKLAVLGLALTCAAGLIAAQQVQDVIAAAAQSEQAARASQSRIDQAVDQTRDLAREYGVLAKEVDGLEVYVALLQKQVDSQLTEIENLNTSIDSVSVIERQVTPLMIEMIESLDQLIALDVPFLLEERQKRVTFLRGLLERSDVTVAEKFRRVLEAYEIENDYGRTIEVYKGSLELDGASREVDFLRIGRAALLYQTVDSEIFGMWDAEQKTWVPLGAEYRNQIRTGIQMARKQIAPDLLLLPVRAPEVAK
jgi:hypothetical protein